MNNIEENAVFVNGSPRKPWTMIPHSLLNDSRMTWDEKGILCLLFSLTDGDNFDIKNLADIIGYTPQTISKKIKKYVELGYLNVGSDEDYARSKK
jgi:DNA-binding MarR family transcriptional regulator